MTALETISVIFAVIILAKFVFLLFMKPKMIKKMAEKMLKKPMAITILYLIFAVILGYYLLAELTIVQIIPAMFFGIMLYALMLIQYPKLMLGFSKEYAKDRWKVWPFWLIYIALSVWVLYVVFA